ncbi:MAG TPA: hypothetical protein PKD53_01205 [Chloroflexaceae bacterium]|nr:hypothetical protein [Chloroflexaceae bacterium]
MLQGWAGLLIALALTALLARQAARAARGTRLRQTYSLAAGGFGLIIALNALFLLGVAGELLSSTVGFVAVALLIGAAVSFVMAMLNGEFGAKLRQAQAYTAEERERIARRRLERERAAGQDERGQD